MNQLSKKFTIHHQNINYQVQITRNEDNQVEILCLDDENNCYSTIISPRDAGLIIGSSNRLKLADWLINEDETLMVKVMRMEKALTWICYKTIEGKGRPLVFRIGLEWKRKESVEEIKKDPVSSTHKENDPMDVRIDALDAKFEKLMAVQNTISERFIGNKKRIEHLEEQSEENLRNSNDRWDVWEESKEKVHQKIKRLQDSLAKIEKTKSKESQVEQEFEQFVQKYKLESNSTKHQLSALKNNFKSSQVKFKSDVTEVKELLEKFQNVEYMSDKTKIFDQLSSVQSKCKDYTDASDKTVLKQVESRFGNLEDCVNASLDKLSQKLEEESNINIERSKNFEMHRESLQNSIDQSNTIQQEIQNTLLLHKKQINESHQYISELEAETKSNFEKSKEKSERSLANVQSELREMMEHSSNQCNLEITKLNNLFTMQSKEIQAHIDHEINQTNRIISNNRNEVKNLLMELQNLVTANTENFQNACKLIQQDNEKEKEKVSALTNENKALTERVTKLENKLDNLMSVLETKSQLATEKLNDLSKQNKKLMKQTVKTRRKETKFSSLFKSHANRLEEIEQQSIIWVDKMSFLENSMPSRPFSFAFSEHRRHPITVLSNRNRSVGVNPQLTSPHSPIAHFLESNLKDSSRRYRRNSLKGQLKKSSSFRSKLSSRWVSVMANEILSYGIYEWTIKIDSGDCSISVGVCHPLEDLNIELGRTKRSWGLSLGNKTMVHDEIELDIDIPDTQTIQEVTFHLNLMNPKNGNLKAMVNGRSIDNIFDTIQGPVVAFVSLLGTSNHQITLKKTKRLK